MAFMPNELGHDLKHGIVCPTEPIFAHMHAYSDGKQCSCWGVFIISAQKNLIFIIRAPKDGFLSSTYQETVSTRATKIFKNTIPHCIYKSPTGCTSKDL
jgi:hypothetical protein